MTSSMLEDQVGLPHGAKLFYPSERPPLKIPVRGMYYDHDIQPRTAGRSYKSQFSHFNALKIPLHVAKRLFANYRDDILPRFPCFVEGDLEKYFDHFFNMSNPDHKGVGLERFMVPMILAISCLTSNSHEFSKVAALSESLHSDAMRHTALLRNASIEALQCLILLIQHALVLPYAANLWYLAGEAVRMAVSLGLHQEPSPAIVADPAEAEQRRRLFWLVGSYSLESVVV